MCSRLRGRKGLWIVNDVVLTISRRCEWLEIAGLSVDLRASSNRQ